MPLAKQPIIEKKRAPENLAPPFFTETAPFLPLKRERWRDLVSTVHPMID
jgi:hypothetical protein